MMRKPRTCGYVAQKMMSFRLDYVNSDWLQLYPNKGRYINNLIRDDKEFDFSVLAEKLRSSNKARKAYDEFFARQVF